jgi:hypothetical protein
MALLYGRAGRLTAKTDGFRPGQSTKRWDELNSEIASLKKQLAAAGGGPSLSASTTPSSSSPASAIASAGGALPMSTYAAISTALDPCVPFLPPSHPAPAADLFHRTPHTIAIQ